MIENRILCVVICIEIITNLNQIIMKLFSLFKKETSKEVKSNIQKMDKKQLEKVIGGGDDSGSTDLKVPPSIRGVVIDKGLR